MRVSPLLPLAVALLALLPRVGPALAVFRPSPDACEHLLIARSLAAGEGFVLPVKVRFDAPGPVVHDAYPERAPLLPWLLAPFVALGWGRSGWPDPTLQLVPAALAAAAAGLATWITAALGRRRGLRGRSLHWAALAGGLVVAWAPSLVRASVHLWAEPLGLLLVLAALRTELALDARQAEAAGEARLALAAGVLGGLARFARPEAWVLAPLLVLLAARRSWRQAGWVLGALVAVNAVGVAGTGVLAPQLFLLEVADFHDVMDPAVTPAPPSLAVVAAGIGRNLLGQLEHLLLPKNGFFVVPLALLALGWREARGLWLAAASLFLATAAVWSTHDPHRFTIAPLGLLAPVAAVAFEEVRRRWARGRGWPLALYVGLLVGVLGHASGRVRRGRPPPPPPAVVAQEGVAHVADPWAYALITGRPAVFVPPAVLGEPLRR